MTKHIAVPAEAVRTREQILEGQVIVRGCVWLPCWNCGGNGTYPSSCIPAGMCRLYCWAAPFPPGSELAALIGVSPPHKDRSDPTYGRRATLVEKYVKQQQASDRRRYRDGVRWEQERPEREAREAVARAEAEARAAERRDRDRHAEEMNNERLAAIAAEKAKRVHVGTVGERLDLRVTYESFRRIEGTGSYGWQAQTRYLFRFRDEAGNLLVLWTSMPPCQVDRTGQTFHLRGTVKEHTAYDGEAQTVIQRVKLEQEAHVAA